MADLKVKVSSSSPTNGGYFKAERARGTNEIPASTQNGDVLGGVSLLGYDGTNYVETVEIVAKATENWAGGAAGTSLEFYTTENQTDTKTKRMTVSQDGNVIFGETADSNYKLDIDGNMRISGDLFIDGTSFIVLSEIVEVEDNMMVINSGEVGAGVTEGYAGIQIDRGSETDYRFVFDEPTDTFRVGEIGDLQAVATRQDSPVSTGIAYWNDTDKRFDTESGLTYVSSKLTLTSGTGINEFSTDGTLAGDSDDAVPTEKAVKAYVDNNISHVTDGVSAGQMLFWNGSTWTYTETTELYWDDTNKRIGIGSATPESALNIKGSGAESSRLVIERNEVSASAPSLYFYNSRNVALTQDDDNLGSIVFQGCDGTAALTAAAINVYADSAWGLDDAPSRMVFQTVTDGASTLTTRMTIDNAGLVSLSSGTGINEFSTDGTLGGNSDDAVPTEQAVKTYVDTEIGSLTTIDTGTAEGQIPFWDGTKWTYLETTELSWDDVNKKLQLGSSGTSINEFSTDGTFADNSDDAVPTEKAVKTYVDNAMSNISDGTNTGQMLFWDGDEWTSPDVAELYWDNTNTRLGVGTSSPSVELHVDGSIQVASGSSVNNISTSTTLDGAGASDNTLATQLAIKTYVENALADYIQGDSELYWDDVNNRLGIRTNVPSHALDVNGDANFEDSVYIGVGDATTYLTIGLGTAINEFSTDGTLAGNSDDAVPTEQAVKTYVDNAVSSISDGTSTGQMLFWDGDEWTSPTTSELYWDSVNSRVGIGTSTPANTLDVNGTLILSAGTSISEFSTDGTLAGNSDDAVPTEQAVKTYVDNAISIDDGTSTGQMLFWDGDEWTFTDANGLYWDNTNMELGLGSTLTESFVPRLTIADDDAANAGMAAYGYETIAAQSPIVYLAKARGTKLSPSIVADDDTLGKWQCAGYDGNGFLNAALIRAVVDGTPGTNDMPTRLQFEVTADGASNTTERMRLGNNGKLAIGDQLDMDDPWNGGLTLFDEGANDLSSITSYTYATNANSGALWFGKARGTKSSATIVADDDTIGLLSFNAWDGNNFVNAAIIRASIDGTPGDDDMPTRFEFFTAADGEGSASERMRLTNDGKLILGSDLEPNSFGNYGVQLLGEGANTYSSISSTTYQTGTQGGSLSFQKARGTKSSPTVPSENDWIGSITGNTWDGDQFLNTAGIALTVGGTVSDNSTYGDIIFYTADASAGMSERMRLYSDGKLQFTTGTGINEFSIDGTLSGNSDDAVPTEKAVKTYVDNATANISDGTSTGQMLFWDGDEWNSPTTTELYWDSVNSRVGIGTSTPANTLSVNGTLILASGTSINEFSTDGTLSGDSDDAVPTEKAVKAYVDNAGTTPGGSDGYIQYNDGGSFGGESSLFWEDVDNNLGVGTTDQFAGGSGVIGIADATSVPNTDPTGGGVMYVENGAAKYRSSSGTITTFGPADPHCPVCGKDYMLEFQNGDDYFAMCMPCLAKELGSKPWIITK